MRMIKTKTKIEVIGAILILLSVTFASVLAVTRNISNDNDDLVTYIQVTDGGVYDNTNAGITSAVSSLLGQPGKITLPAGTLTITSPIEYHTGLQIVGAGRDVTIIDSSAITTDYAIKPASHTTEIQKVLFRDFTIDGGTPRTNKHGMLLQDTWESTMTRVKIMNISDTALVLDGHENGTAGWSITNCKFIWSDNACNFTVSGTNGYVNLNIFEACSFSGCVEYGVYMPGVNGKTFGHNSFESCHFESEPVGIYIGHTGGASVVYTRIIQPYFDTCTSYDIQAGDRAFYTEMEGGLKHPDKISATRGLSFQSAKTSTFTVAPTGTNRFADFYCDGTDDEVQINYALALTDCEVKLLAGTYTIGASVTPDKDDVLSGEGMTNTIITTATDNLDLLYISTTNVTIKDLHIKGFKTGTGSDLCVWSQIYDDITFINVKCSETMEEGFYFYRVDNIKMINCVTSNVRTGVKFVECKDNSIIGGELNSSTTVNLYSIDSDNILVDGTKITHATQYGIRLTTCNRWRIVNCLISKNAYSGIFFDATHNTTFANNDCSENTQNGVMVNGNSGACSYNIITGNVCNSNGQDGVEIGGTHPPEKTVVTSNNLLFNGATNLADAGSNTVTDNNLT